MQTSTPRSSNSRFNSGPSQAAPPYVTLSILVAGVIGGLLIVVAVLLCCKYCVNKDKTVRRAEVPDSRRISERGRQTNKPLQRYETINSDVFSEPSTGSMDGIPVSPRKTSFDHYPDVEEVNETTRLKADFEKAIYKDLDIHDQADYGKQTERTECTPETTDQQDDRTGRRVSFQLDDLPSNSSMLRRGRRYTEGDFHHLKRARIEKKVPRQSSFGAPFYHVDQRSSPPLDGKSALPFLKEHMLSNQDRRISDFNMIQSGIDQSPASLSYKREVAVEIHQPHANYRNKLDIMKFDSTKLKLPALYDEKRVRSHSYSLDASSYVEKENYNNRKTKSFEEIGDYDLLKITEFKGPSYNTDFDVISELGSPGRSKVRYNDTGSLEQLDNEMLDNLDFYEEMELDTLKLEESDDTETLNGAQKYRELWNLRTTFEEEEECSDTIRMEDMTSPDQSPDNETPNSYTTSFESNTEYISYEPNRKNSISTQSGDNHRPSVPNLLHPNYENRRQTYKSILTRRCQEGTNGGGTNSAENSFDSIETAETDGDVSDTSRYEMTTTSFESTTDNTDSTTESQNHRLIQMKADSGYKSLETQLPYAAVKRNHSTGEIEDDLPELEQTSSERIFCHAHSLPEPGASGDRRYFDRRSAKTASRKRREYSKERQMVQIHESINEPETESKSDQPSEDSFEETPVSSKLSVFSRFFKSHREPKTSLTRDYSIDEKTNRLFQEFIRYDPKLETRTSIGSGGRSHRLQRNRLHRKHSDVMYFEDRRRDRLAPEMRSASLGSDSSASSVRRLSPQDSIEEEDYEEIREAEEMERKMLQRDIPARQSISVHEIPIIKLPEEESLSNVR